MRSQTHSSSKESIDVTALLEFSTLLSSSLDLQFILDSFLLTLMGKFLLSKSVIVLFARPRYGIVRNGKGIPKDLFVQELYFPRIPKKAFRLPTESIPHLSHLSAAGINQMFPIISHGEILGYFGIGTPRLRERLTAADADFIQALISIAAAAIANALSFDAMQRVNRVLDGKVQELKTLFELSKEFNAALDRERLLRLFTYSLMGQIGASRYAVCLADGTVVSSKVNTAALLEFKQTMYAHIRTAVRVEDFEKQKKLRGLHRRCEQEGVRVIVPLQIQHEIRGMVCLGERFQKKVYSDSDLEFIYSLGNLAIISLENSRLFLETVEKEKMENELAIAREIQNGLLPRSIARIEGFEIAALNLPSKQVGGDYYDVLLIEDGTVVIAIGDVSGKGTPASLLMANVQATIRTLTHFGLSMSDMTTRVNHLISENTTSGKFITLFWGTLDPRTRVFRYVNAGHNHPFLVRADGSIERLTEGGIILGIMKNVPPYEEGQTQLRTGDCIVMFTDGISEAMNKEGVDYTEERVEEFLRGISRKNAQGVVDEIQMEIARYSVGVPQSDDITLVVLKCT